MRKTGLLILCAVAIMSCAAAAMDDCMCRRSTEANDASGFVNLAKEVPDVLVETRYYSTYNFVGARIDGYEQPVALITREAAQALRQVSERVMRDGYRLKVWDAYRPQQAVDHFVRWSHTTDTTMKRYFYPNLEKLSLFPEYVALKSGHTHGSTVDLTLWDMRTASDVDMGGTFDFFGERSHSFFEHGLTKEQIANRMYLRQVMTDAGFDPYDSEWWHFTLHDNPYSDIFFTFPVNDSVLNHSF